MKGRLLTVVLLSVAGVVASSPAAAMEPVCLVAKGKLGLSGFLVDSAPDNEGNIRISSDFDGDGVLDTLLWFQTGSASLIPPDFSKATVTLSSTSKTFTVEDQRVLVVMYAGKYYVVTNSLATERGPWKETVYAVGSRGMSKLCSFGGQGIGR